MADLLAAHWVDVPTVDPRYWTEPPESARRLLADPGLVRMFGVCDQSSGEPGYASRPVDYLQVRNALDWSLPLAWRVPSSRGITPMISRRRHNFSHLTEKGTWRYDLEGNSHIVASYRLKGLAAQPAGHAFIHANPGVLPRARLAGRPVYVDNEAQAAEALARLRAKLRDALVVEDPTRPLPADVSVSGTARIALDLPEHVVVETDSPTPAYLVLSDTFDPGWTATVDDQPVPIRPAYLAFRAVFVPEGKHQVVFRYRPAGFGLGLLLTCSGTLVALCSWFLPRSKVPLREEHTALNWPARWRTWWFAALAAIVIVSIPIPVPAYGPEGQPIPGPEGRRGRWAKSLHPFTWGSGIEAMRERVRF